MNSSELIAIREKLGIGVVEFGAALGYRGSGDTVGRLMRRFESDGREIPDHVADVAAWYGRHGLIGNIPEPQNPRASRGQYGDFLLHGDREAVRGFILVTGARSWLHDWFYTGGRNYLQFPMPDRTPVLPPTRMTAGPETSQVAAIMAVEPILVKDGSDHRGTLLGAKLATISNRDGLARWVSR